MNEHKIYILRGGSLTDADRIELARLLIKAGYTVRIGRETPPGGSKSVVFVGYSAGGAR